MFRQGTNWHRFAALVAIVGLHFQVALAALAIPAAFAAMHPGDLPEGYSTIVICTGDGMKRITLDADGSPVGETERDLPGQQCAACHLVGGTLFFSSTPAPLDGVEHPCFRQLPVREQSRAERPAYLIAPSRAPPA